MSQQQKEPGDQQQCRRKERIELPYKNDSSRYRLTKEDAGEGVNKFARRQFIHIYRTRIGLLRERLMGNARKKLGMQKLNMIDISNRNNTNSNVFVVGSVLKKMKYRQSVLYEFADDTNFQAKYMKRPGENITDEEDVLELEEEQQTLKLTGNIDKQLYVTGDVIGVFGSQLNGSDEFAVQMVVLPELPEQVPWPLIEKDCYLAFISGLSLSNKLMDTHKTYMALGAFHKWLNGLVVPTGEQAEDECQIMQNVARLVIAGDWAQADPLSMQWQKVSTTMSDCESGRDCISHFDRFLGRFLQNIPVDLMPGANDPTQMAIPQQPVPWMLFKSADRLRPMLNTVTNPYNFSVAGIHFLGTSGQNVNDLDRLTRGMGPLDRMERTLRMGHLFPTVPDTLAGFPFGLRDPMVLEQLPHVYFCGNQPKFESRMVEGMDNSGKRCLLLAIPKFSKTFEAVLLNLRTMHSFPYSFDLDWNLPDMAAVENVDMENEEEEGRKTSQMT